MTRHKLLSWALSLVMALTVFSIPVGGVYAEADGPQPVAFALAYWANDGEDLVPITQSEVNLSEIDPFLSVCGQFDDEQWQDFDTERYTIIWKNKSPDTAKAAYWDENDMLFVPTVNDEGVQEFQWSNGTELMPRKAGTVNLEVSIYNENNDPVSPPISLAIIVEETDLPQYCIAINQWNEATQESTPIPVQNGTVDFSKLVGENSLCVCSDEFKGEENPWEICNLEDQKIEWHNNSTDVAVVRIYDEEMDEFVRCDSDTFQANEIRIEPISDGPAQFTVDVYSDREEDASLVATIPITVNITPKDVDRAKYKPFLDWYDLVWYADVDELAVWGEYPNYEDYNSDMEGEFPVITADDMKKLKIEAIAGGISKEAILNQDYHEFHAKIAKVALGSKVTVKYTMGTYTKTETLVASKRVNPKVTVKSYVYNGKYRKASVTVKVGKTTLKPGKDYTLASKSLKNVGRAYYELYNPNDRFNKYRFYKEGYFKTNPKGTSLKKLKRAKKAFTATWAKQATRMSTSRITGYQIQYSTSKKFTKKTTKLVTVKGYATTSKKIKKLKKKKTYYVRVRTYKKVGKITYYSTWSKAKAVKTK